MSSPRLRTCWTTTEGRGAVRTPRPTRLGRFMAPMCVHFLEVKAFHEPCPLSMNLKMRLLISKSLSISGSWPVSRSERNNELSMNRKVGLGVLTPPPGMLDTSDGRGGVRTPSPTRLWRFRGSKREVLFRRILTLFLSPGGGEETRSRFTVPMRVRLFEVQATPRRERIFSSAGEESPIKAFFRHCNWRFPLLGERVKVRASLDSNCMSTVL